MKNNRFQQKASCSTFASCQHEKELINISTMNYQGGVCNLCPYLSLKATAAPSPGVWTSVSVITNHVLADQTLRRRFVMVCELCVSVSITQAELPAAHLLLLLLLKLPHLALPHLCCLPHETLRTQFSLGPVSPSLSRTPVRSLSLSEEGVIDWPVRLRWEVCSQCSGGLHLSQRQSIATPLLPFKAPHSCRQSGGGEERGEQ